MKNRTMYIGKILVFLVFRPLAYSWKTALSAAHGATLLNYKRGTSFSFEFSLNINKLNLLQQFLISFQCNLLNIKRICSKVFSYYFADRQKFPVFSMISTSCVQIKNRTMYIGRSFLYSSVFRGPLAYRWKTALSAFFRKLGFLYGPIRKKVLYLMVKKLF